MKTSNGRGNGYGETVGTHSGNESIEGNPYLQSVVESRRNHADDDQSLHLSLEEDDTPPIDREEELKRAKERRRRFVLVGILALFLVGLLAAVNFYYRGSTRVEYGTRPKQREVPSPPNANSGSPRDSRTEQAIAEAQRITEKQTDEKAKPTRDAANEVSQKSGSKPEIPFVVPPGFNETVKPQSETPNTKFSEGNSAGDRSTQSPSTSNPQSDTKIVRSQRSSETSIYIAGPVTDLSHSAPTALKAKTDNNPSSAHVTSNEAVVVPPFASMLPVRTIGALYTLRSGALVRLALSRDMKGEGWSLKRGTILVGTNKGSDFDRAYVGILGFIDPNSGKLVKLGGEVQGGDGGAGLKGKRRQLESGWVRAFGRLGDAALDISGALLSGRGRDTVIVSEGLRTKTINPITEEISGVIGGELDRRQGRSFVEVAVGTPGYVMVTDLPSVIKGTEPVPNINSDSLAGVAEVDAIRPATGLSERELAELLANGSPEDIRAAMPRMSPEMKKIAALVLQQ